jgi:D-glycero-D-manno-heptose 1,7-bisphosphate phosphatase
LTSRALFLDRDGVINVDHGHVFTQDQFEFVDGIIDVCRCATDLGYVIFVVTNQAGIGRGYYSEREFLELTEWMCGVFRDHGAPIRKVYYCPFHPEHGVGIYKADSTCRKPGPGMILQAATEFNIDLKRSVLVGDKESDIQAGIAAGVGCNLLYVPQQDSRRLAPPNTATSTVAKLADVQPFLKEQIICRESSAGAGYKESLETPSQVWLGEKTP